MNHDGAYLNNIQQYQWVYAPCWCIFILSVYKALAKAPAEMGFEKQIIRVIKPRRAPQEAPTWHLCSFAESVIVGNTLPSEVFVPKAPIKKGGGVLSQR